MGVGGDSMVRRRYAVQDHHSEGCARPVGVRSPVLHDFERGGRWVLARPSRCDDGLPADHACGLCAGIREDEVMRRTPAWAFGTVVACGRLAPGEPSPGPPPQGPAAQVWLTTGSGSKLLSRETDVHFDSGAPPATLLRIVVDEGTAYQEIVGFGAAITVAPAWLNQIRLPPAMRDAVLKVLFGPSHWIGLCFTFSTMVAINF